MCIVLVLGVGRCAFRPPRVVFVLGPVSLINSLTSGKKQINYQRNLYLSIDKPPPKQPHEADHCSAGAGSAGQSKQRAGSGAGVRTGQSFDKFFLKFGWVRPRHKFRANLGLWPDFRAEATLWAKF